MHFQSEKTTIASWTFRFLAPVRINIQHTCLTWVHYCFMIHGSISSMPRTRISYLWIQFKFYQTLSIKCNHKNPNRNTITSHNPSICVRFLEWNGNKVLNIILKDHLRNRNTNMKLWRWLKISVKQPNEVWCDHRVSCFMFYFLFFAHYISLFLLELLFDRSKSIAILSRFLTIGIVMHQHHHQHHQTIGNYLFINFNF